MLVPIAEFVRNVLGINALGLYGFVYGVVLIFVVLFVPNGIMGLLRNFGHKKGAADASDMRSPPMVVESVERPRPEPGDEVLRATDLNLHFGGLHVTNNVSLRLREGEILGLIGPNGAGKTTLFNMLSGFILPDSGTVEIKGPEGTWHRPRRPAEFASLGLGRTFQIVQPFAAMTVEENIMVGAFHRHVNVNDAREAARQTAERMGLSRYLDAEAASLTIGGLKRLEVARVMAMEPRILLLDEVMAGINQTDVALAIDLMLSIRDTGVSIIAIEHVMQAVMSLSDHVIVLNSGKLIAEGAPREVVRDEQVIEAYLGKEFSHA